MGDTGYVDSCAQALREDDNAWFAREWLTNRGLSHRTLRNSLLGYDAQRKAVVIPYLNPDGSVRTYRYRSLNGEPKYLWPRGSSQHLYNVGNTKATKVWLCEGEFDSLILGQLGFNTVGVPGVNAFASEWKYLFVYCDQVTVVFDGDGPGKEGAQRVSGLLSPYVNKLRLVRLPEGKDVTDLFKENVRELRELVT